jgi:hypothetical protein
MREIRPASAGEGGAGAEAGRSFVPLGIIASSAPAAALLASLKEIRPQFDVRLRRISDEHGIETLFRVEVAAAGPSAQAHSIDTWLHIKSALVAAFPAGKPGAVKTIDP